MVMELVDSYNRKLHMKFQVNISNGSKDTSKIKLDSLCYMLGSIGPQVCKISPRCLWKFFPRHPVI